MNIEVLPVEVLVEVMIIAKSWKDPRDIEDGDYLSAMSVCRKWRAVMMNNPINMIHLLLQVSTDVEDALVRACSLGHESIVRLLLERPEKPRADCKNGLALACAAKNGHKNILQMLLDWHDEHDPHTYMFGKIGNALNHAVIHGHETIVRLLLQRDPIFSRIGSKSYNRFTHALCSAAAGGHNTIIQVLLTWHKCVRADCMQGWALIRAAEKGHENTVQLLLKWPEYAPRADCREGLALAVASENGHENIVKMLLEWPENAPCAESILRWNANKDDRTPPCDFWM